MSVFQHVLLVFTFSNRGFSYRVSVRRNLNMFISNLLLFRKLCSDDFLCLSAGTDVGSWCLLNIQRDLMVVSCSSPNCPPSLVGYVGFIYCSHFYTVNTLCAIR